MKKLNNHLNTFGTIIQTLNELNSNSTRIGGSMLFELYGLKFHRVPDDIDIIITNPNKDQELFLKTLRLFRSHEKGDYIYYGGDNFKIKKNGCILNILVVREYKQNILPIFYQHNNYNYPLVTINEILDAKRKYKRTKDIYDFEKLKNLNFNING